MRNLQNIPQLYKSQLTVKGYRPKALIGVIVDLEPFLLQ